MSDALAAEWIKLRTVRSTPVILAVVLALCGAALLLVVYFVVTYDSLPPEGGPARRCRRWGRSSRWWPRSRWRCSACWRSPPSTPPA
ncbi:hypothetical protein [Thermocatellispora tengchongensis]|uniref:hypothetical protein n=1 Tax=Thermocatellispora tengchongensis TaxID=1073253 RepID=UPI003636E8B3